MSAPLTVDVGDVGEPAAVHYSRTTKDGRRLHYEMICLQQPERARACGSGQKCMLPGNSLLPCIQPC